MTGATANTASVISFSAAGLTVGMIRNIHLRVSNDAGFSDIVTTTVIVERFVIQADPLEPEKTALFDGADLLIGGAGRDSLVGGKGADMLITDAVFFTYRNEAWGSLLSEWTSSRNYSAKVQNITNQANATFADRQNGSVSDARCNHR